MHHSYSESAVTIKFITSISPCLYFQILSLFARPWKKVSSMKQFWGCNVTWIFPHQDHRDLFEPRKKRTGVIIRTCLPVINLLKQAGSQIYFFGTTRVKQKEFTKLFQAKPKTRHCLLKSRQRFVFSFPSLGQLLKPRHGKSLTDGSFSFGPLNRLHSFESFS